MKIFFSAIAILLFPLLAFSQVDTTVKYYNKYWKICSRDSAVYYSNVFKEGNKWKRVDYFASTKKPEMIGFYKDAATKNQDGQLQYFDEKGNLTSQSLIVWRGKFYYEKEYSAFYPDGKLEGKMVKDTSGKILVNEMYDENGRKIKHAIFYKEPQYSSGGIESWMYYLQNNLNYNIAFQNHAPVGKYIVTVDFVVKKDGSIDDVNARNNPGFGTQEEAVRVIEQSGKWQPAIRENKPIDYKERERIIFVVRKKY